MVIDFGLFIICIEKSLVIIGDHRRVFFDKFRIEMSLRLMTVRVCLKLSHKLGVFFCLNNKFEIF